MLTTQLAQMMTDKHVFNLKKMQNKYSPEDVDEMLVAMAQMSYHETTLVDFHGNNCVYQPNHATVHTGLMKRLLMPIQTKENFGRRAMEEEIDATLQIENIYSDRNSVRKILAGYAPQQNEEKPIYGLKQGLDFIADTSNKITETNLYKLYMMSVGDFLEGDDRLQEGQRYRHDQVYIMGNQAYHQGLDAKLLPQYMQNFITFANESDGIPELVKACMLHFQFAYLHPYFDGNGRTARLLHLWYLVQQGFSSTLFYAFSNHINQSKAKYYNSFLLVENNLKISNTLDFTPFIAYFKEYVYGKVEYQNDNSDGMELYQTALAEGKITEKEAALWQFVLSAYGDTIFSTKMLERDFNNAAYATIRNFVLKFEALGLLTAQRYGNRVKYCVE